MLKIIIILLCFIPPSHAEMKLLNFNTMCDLCKGSSYSEYPQRLAAISNMIAKHAPDLLSLQEFRTSAQAKEALSFNSDYKIISHQSFLYNYSDAIIAFKQSKYKLIEYNYFWLGPRTDQFSFGWKFALPRIVLWARLKHIQSNKEFLIVGSHLDNRIENLTGSAKALNNFLQEQTLPFILAADTNITKAMPQYSSLTTSLLDHVLDINPTWKTSSSYKESKELCYLKKGKKFPECMVEHIFLSRKHEWKVESTLIDLSRFKNNFLSDHRPIITTIGL